MSKIAGRLTDKATSTTLIGGVALAAMMIDAGQYWPAVVVYGTYCIKEGLRYLLGESD